MRIYSQKYMQNMDKFDDYLFITNLLSQFILEQEIDGDTGEEMEAIVVEDSSNSPEAEAESFFSDPLSASDSLKLGEKTRRSNSGNPNYQSGKTLKTLELSEDEKSQLTFKGKKQNESEKFQKLRNPEALEIELEEEEEEEEDELSFHNPSPRSRYGWKAKKISPKHKSAKSNRSQQSQLSKLSRKPNKSIRSGESHKKEANDTIEMSEFEFSGNSYPLPNFPKSDSQKVSSQSISESAQSKLLKKLKEEQITGERKDKLIKTVTEEWVEEEITD
jgi:hypothetical protein